jgi:formyltetrahydrofolate deformylase
MGTNATTLAIPATVPDDSVPGRRHRILVSCQDTPGIVAAVAGFLGRAGANITHSAQYSTDPHGGTLLMRMQFELDLDDHERASFEQKFAAEVADHFKMNWRLSDVARPRRIAIMVSRYDHCLLDLLGRWRRHEINAEIAVVISNHDDLRVDVESFGIPFVHLPVAKGHKPKAEASQLACLAEHGPLDTVVLARYMQILSGNFLERLGVPVINIHHSFLPSFAGAGPYEKARERGVKLIGATAHYVTEDLDAGPIIEQDVVRVAHEHEAATLERMGGDVERIVLARAVGWHCEDRVLVYGNRTVVF